MWQSFFGLFLMLLMLSLLVLPVRSVVAELPPDSAYVRAEGEELVLDGNPVRYWGLVLALAGNPQVKPEDSAEVRRQKVEHNRRAIDRMAERVVEMGFNLVRTWEGRYPNQPGLPLLNHHDYDPGDGSEADAIAYAWASLDKVGVKLWMSSTNGLGDIDPERDVNVIDDPGSAAAWKAAIKELAERQKRPVSLRNGYLLAAIDPRTEAIWIQRLRRLTDFPNKYKGGLRLGDDPQIVVWELTNEEFPFRHYFRGDWQALPSYFRNQLLNQWVAFLRKKYGTEQNLIRAWGYLLPGESLDGGTIALMPLRAPQTGEVGMNDSNPAAIESLRARLAEQPVTRDDFNRRRGEDVIAFGCELIIGHKQRLEKALETMGKSCRLAPTVYDSGNAFQIQEAFLHQHADAVSTCSYAKGMGHDPTDKRFPFYSQLEDSPRTCWGVPWLEQSSMLGKPHFVYETMIDNRTKYRAEYPNRVAALASIQNWAIVVWHTYPGRDRALGEPDGLFNDTLNAGGDAFTICGDEVMIAALRSAGEIFRHRLVPPAPRPTIFRFGRKTLQDPVSMNYGKSYGDYSDAFTATAYRYGLRVVIDPTRELDQVDGPIIRPNVYEPCPVKPHDAIAFDWRRGNLIFDSPAVAAFTGFFGAYGAETVAFRQGVKFSDITVRNSEGIAYPVTPEERYVSISLTSSDGQPLAQSRRMTLTAVSTSLNTGYALDLTRSHQGRQSDGPLNVPPREYWGPWTTPGKAPTLVARVGVSVHAPAIDGMRYVMRDFQRRILAEGTVVAGQLIIPADRPVFLVELTRP